MLIIFLFILLTACIYDLRYKKIPNLLSFTVLILGLVGNTFLNNQLGFMGSLYGLMAGFFCSLFFYSFASLGAGDVKLMTAIGAVVGYKLILPIMAYSYVVSACLGIIYAKLWMPLYRKRKFNCSDNKPKKLLSQRIPMAPGICIATFYVLYNHPL